MTVKKDLPANSLYKKQTLLQKVSANRTLL